jgi:predicted Zn-dependent protease
MPVELLEKQYTARKLAARQDELLNLARKTVRASQADETQVRILSSDSALTRFANTEMHQSTFERNAAATVTARIAGSAGLQEGMATSNRLTEDGLREAAARALAAARLSPGNAELAELPQGPFEYPFAVDYYEASAACTPEERARKIVKGFQVNGDSAFSAAGFLSSGQINCVVASSRGVEAAWNTTAARFQILWTGPNSSGMRDGLVRDISTLQVEELSTAALAVAQRTANPRPDLPAGRYSAVLLAPCIATMLGHLAQMGFSGKDYMDGSSFLYGRLGEPLCGANITILDDATEPRTLGVPFDMAGVPKQRLALIEKGVARSVVHDANSAARAGVASTGHDSGLGIPVAQNLVLLPGSSSLQDIIAGVERGVLVQRFYYTNSVDPMATVFTGMTRDGVQLIENGELVCGLTNFRLTQNILEALKNCSALATEQVLSPNAYSNTGCLVPEAIRVEDFNFSGKTSF